MIKIQIDNVQLCKQAYINEISGLVAFRVSILHQCLSHLNGSVSNINNGDLRSVKAIVQNIFTIIEANVNLTTGRDGYFNAISGYRAGPNNLGRINIVGLIQFCGNMLANNNLLLSRLLVCEAVDLKSTNDDILDNDGINTDIDISILKLAFDYKKYNEDISSRIKHYFRQNNFAKFCPYCNIKSAYHHVNNFGEVVDSYELDHFYDKARYPLLSYSLFNLVPSDHTCNVTNKGRTEFNDEHHLNPHLSGYSDEIKFIPIGLTPKYDVDRIELEISAAQGSILYRKVNGNNIPTLEHGNLGNLNVFKIRSKYLNEKHRARNILKILKKNDSYLKHTRKYLQQLTGLNLKECYKEWYEEEFNVSFDPLNFNDKAFSKFSRDIHDHYYSINGSIMNRYIIELINEN